MQLLGKEGVSVQQWMLTLMLVAMSALMALWLGRRKSTVPGPLFTLPLVGETLELLSRGPTVFFMDRYRRYGPIFRTSILGQSDVYCVLEPSLVRALLRGEGTAFFMPPQVATLIGDIGHIVDGPDHTYFRRIFSTSTSPAAIDRALSGIVELIRSQLATQEAAGRQLLNEVASNIVAELALQVIVGLELKRTDRTWFKNELRTYVSGLFSPPVNLPGFAYHRSGQARRNVLQALCQELEPHIHQLLQEDPACGAEAPSSDRDLTEPYKINMARAFEAAAEPPDVAAQRDQSDRARLNALVSESLRRLAAVDAVSNGGRDAGGGSVGKEGGGAGSVGQVAGAPSASVLSRQLDAQLEMLRSLKSLSPDFAAERILGALNAAVDTSRKSMMVILCLLAELPEETDKLRAEQDKLIAEHGEAITPAVLAAASYLDGFCREASRLLPGANLLMRIALRDLQVGGHIVPKNALLVYSSDLLHAVDPVLWDGKLGSPGTIPPHMDYHNNLRGAFQPERWLSEATRPKHMFTFSGGAHTCLGMNLVYTELKVLVALMVRGGYRVSFDKPGVLHHTKLFPTINLPKDNQHVRIWRPATPA